MSRVIALCFLLLAAVIGVLHLDTRPAWAPFADSLATVVEEVVEEELPLSASSPKQAASKPANKLSTNPSLSRVLQGLTPPGCPILALLQSTLDH